MATEETACKKSSPCSSDGIIQQHVIGVDVQVIRGCRTPRQDQLCHGYFAGHEHILTLQAKLRQSCRLA